MDKKRKYHVIIGSKAYFDSKISEIDTSQANGFLDRIRLWDKINVKSSLGYKDFEEFKASKLIIKNDNYHAIAEAALDRLGALIEDVTKNDADIYVHNPPQNLMDFLKDLYHRKLIDLIIDPQKYEIKRDAKSFAESILSIKSKILGQDFAVDEISKSLWYLSNIERKNPYVILLYGNSSLGKTELVRGVAKSFFDGKYTEKHLSMFRNNNYSDYFFGQSPNRRSIGFDLLERESNLVFFDEIDKCPDFFYPAFYTLFDNTLFKDATYDVDVSGIIIVLTGNYQNKEEIKKELGLPIYYRIDKFIHFEDFSPKVIYDVVWKELEERQQEFKDKLTMDKIYNVLSTRIQSTGENARSIKYAVQQVIEELLYEEINKYAD